MLLFNEKFALPTNFTFVSRKKYPLYFLLVGLIRNRVQQYHLMHALCMLVSRVDREKKKPTRYDGKGDTQRKWKG